MNPDVAAAVEQLRRDGLLSAEQSGFLGRLARRELVSAHTELRLALYAGVLLLSGGVGLLLKENIAQLGPVTIAVTVGLVAALCFVWVARHAARFAWGVTPATHLAFDYLLLLGVLIAAADLAYVEAQFTPLGAQWPWHLLIVSLAMGVIAVRYDSRLVFSLALSTFAAWRGVSVSLGGLGAYAFAPTPDGLRANIIGCGLLFLLIGCFVKQAERKAHFEPVAVHMGWIAVLLAILSGIGATTTEELVYALALVATGIGLTAGGAWARRFWLLAMGLVAAYIGVCAAFHRWHAPDEVAALWYAVTPLILLAGLFLAHRWPREPS